MADAGFRCGGLGTGPDGRLDVCSDSKMFAMWVEGLWQVSDPGRRQPVLAIMRGFADLRRAHSGAATISMQIRHIERGTNSIADSLSRQRQADACEILDIAGPVTSSTALRWVGAIGPCRLRMRPIRVCARRHDPPGTAIRPRCQSEHSRSARQR